jgi:hypothetical protein
MQQFSEQLPESTSPFLEMQQFSEQPPESTSPFLEMQQFSKQPSESSSLLPWSAGVLKKIR